jgi:hypothetical protein
MQNLLNKKKDCENYKSQCEKLSLELKESQLMCNKKEQ